ncbi:hypothetical protein [Burkholderia glumae]|uniref:hypothetical protein n=1 Tax=Burkholderia glumae TaxID=337 RepID=UPI00039FB6E8|nr:hypothetical protein [Burkholderia glumae]MCM2492104.1 hypothetical protein [Burkholderia glumae]MCM2543101.1 hypothetical protein [Burkholderia glumae]QJP73625.1 hypothetical protein HJC54_26830 [Burkholderia glumae]
MTTPYQPPRAGQPGAAPRATVVNRAATSAFRRTIGLSVTFAGIVTLAAQVAARLHGAA